VDLRFLLQFLSGRGSVNIDDLAIFRLLFLVN
jgi:hypothetical protein